jgi:hypothetical protein
MKKKSLAPVLLMFAVLGILTGCAAVQNYSLRSYQGPLPMQDYRYVNAEAYGVPAAAARP